MAGRTDVPLPSTPRGRYLSLLSNHTFDNSLPLSLCEVKVYGY